MIMHNIPSHLEIEQLAEKYVKPPYCDRCGTCFSSDWISPEDIHDFALDVIKAYEAKKANLEEQVDHAELLKIEWLQLKEESLSRRLELSRNFTALCTNKAISRDERWKFFTERGMDFLGIYKCDAAPDIIKFVAKQIDLPGLHYVLSRLECLRDSYDWCDVFKAIGDLKDTLWFTDLEVQTRVMFIPALKEHVMSLPYFGMYKKDLSTKFGTNKEG